MPEAAARPLAVVSACLLGRECRYDGRHKLVPGLRDALLAAGCDILPLCPETDSGLGCPRPPIDLHPVPPPGGPLRALRPDGTDCTPALAAWIDDTIAALRRRPPALCILKSKSPSCGIHPPRPGLFATALRDAFPTVPLLDETAPLPPVPDRGAPARAHLPNPAFSAIASCVLSPEGGQSARFSTNQGN